MVCCQIEATCLLGMRSLVGGDWSGSIQTGRANVRVTATLLYKFFDASRPV